MDIKKLQQELTAKGFGPLSDDGILGPKTKAAILQFQQAVGGITPDGSVGPATFAALDAYTGHLSRSLGMRAMQIAESQNGVRELTGKNDGPEVEKYLKSVNLGAGYSWCMAFVYWCTQQAAEQLGIGNPLVKTAGCMAQWNQVNPHFHVSDPQPGDIFILDLGGGSGHTGFVTYVNAEEKMFGTVEGNTNNDGSSNGNGVYLRQRKIGGKLKGFIRIPQS